jgi:hypothetical protein
MLQRGLAMFGFKSRRMRAVVGVTAENFAEYRIT